MSRRLVRQNEVDTPHFQLPLRFGGINGGAFMNQQDTGDDIVDCVRAIIAFPIGTRKDLPEFGIPEMIFHKTTEDLVAQVRAAIEDWDERATVDVSGGTEITDHMIVNLLVRAGVTDG